MLWCDERMSGDSCERPSCSLLGIDAFSAERLGFRKFRIQSLCAEACFGSGEYLDTSIEFLVGVPFCECGCGILSRASYFFEVPDIGPQEIRGGGHRSNCALGICCCGLGFSEKLRLARWICGGLSLVVSFAFSGFFMRVAASRSMRSANSSSVNTLLTILRDLLDKGFLLAKKVVKGRTKKRNKRHDSKIL